MKNIYKTISRTIKLFFVDVLYNYEVPFVINSY